MLAMGADKDALDNIGRSPLMKAAEAGHLAVVNSLLNAGADAEIFGLESESATALHMAAKRGHIRILKAILEHGVDVNFAKENGWTALHSAAWGNHPCVIDMLVEAGAGIDPKTPDGQTPLCFTAKLVISWCKAMRALLHHGANARVRDNEGDTVLHIACRSQSHDLDTAVDLLLRAGADEAIVNIDGDTPAQTLDRSCLHRI